MSSIQLQGWSSAPGGTAAPGWCLWMQTRTTLELRFSWAYHGVCWIILLCNCCFFGFLRGWIGAEHWPSTTGARQSQLILFQKSFTKSGCVKRRECVHVGLDEGRTEWSNSHFKAEEKEPSASLKLGCLWHNIWIHGFLLTCYNSDLCHLRGNNWNRVTCTM